jgi:hypothetical protein
MAIEWVDSFGSYATAQGPLKYSAATIVASVGPRGGSVLRVGSTSTVKQLTAIATRVVGVRYSQSANIDPATLIAFRDSGTAQCDVRLLNTGALQATRNGTVLGTSAASVVQGGNVWQYIEVKVTISDTVGVVEVRVNNNVVLNVTGADTKNTANATTDQVALTGTGNANHNFADLYILNTTGSDNNDFKGDSASDPITVSSAGTTTQWTPSAGSNFQNVDDATPDGDTTYNSSATASQIDLFAMSNIAGAGTVHAIQWNGYVRKDDAGARSIAPMLRSESTDAQGGTQSVSDSYTYLYQVYDVDPADSNDWTLTKINALEAGYKLVS